MIPEEKLKEIETRWEHLDGLIFNKIDGEEVGYSYVRCNDVA